MRQPYQAAQAGNSLTPSSPPMGSSAAVPSRSAWVSTPPVMAHYFSASLYDGHSHIFLRLRDGTHPLAVGPGNSCASDPGQGRSDRQCRWVPEKLGPGRQIVSRVVQKAGVGPTRRSGRDPGSRPYAPIASRMGKPAGSTTHTLPADSALGAVAVADPTAAPRSSRSVPPGRPLLWVRQVPRKTGWRFSAKAFRPSR